MNECTVRQTFKLIDLGIHTELLPEDGFTLDELHRVFECIKFWCEPDYYYTKKKKWQLYDLRDSSMDKDWGNFDKTKNHAQDWAGILIWLRENNHVTAQAVNEALAT